MTDSLTILKDPLQKVWVMLEKIAKQFSVLYRLFFFLLLSGCNVSLEDVFNDVKTSLNKNIQDESAVGIKEYLPETIVGLKGKYKITNAVLGSPSVSVASSRAVASSKALHVIATQKNLTSNLSINAGFFPNGNEMQPGAQATASLTKFIFDFGQTDRQIKLAALETKAAILNAHIAFNSELSKLLANFFMMRSANKSLEKIDEYLSKYRQREILIKTAFQSGVLSRADLLEIDTAKNGILSQYEQIKLSRSQAKRFLQIYLGSQYNAVISELSERLGAGYELKHSIENVRLALLNVQRIVLETEIEIAENSDKLRVNGSVSVSSPTPGNDNFSTFAGFSVSKSILDGGQSVATVDKKKADLFVLSQEQRVAGLDRNLVIETWENYKKYHKLDNQFLYERKKISTEKYDELERLFKAGQADIVELANAILQSAQDDLAIIQLEGDLFKNKLEVTSGLTQPCILIDICGDVQNLFVTD